MSTRLPSSDRCYRWIPVCRSPHQARRDQRHRPRSRSSGSSSQMTPVPKKQSVLETYSGNIQTSIPSSQKLLKSWILNLQSTEGQNLKQRETGICRRQGPTRLPWPSQTRVIDASSSNNIHKVQYITYSTFMHGYLRTCDGELRSLTRMLGSDSFSFDAINASGVRLSVIYLPVWPSVTLVPRFRPLVPSHGPGVVAAIHPTGCSVRDPMISSPGMRVPTNSRNNIRG